MITLLIIISLLISAPSGYGENACTVKIRTQQDFESMDRSVSSCISSGFSDITVSFSPGIYYYDDNVMLLRDANPSVRLHIAGNGAVLCGKRTPVRRGGALNPDFSYSDESSIPCDFWSEVSSSPKPIDVVSRNSRICRIKVADVAGIKAGVSYIQISEWFVSRVYKVQDVRDGYVYFEAPNLEFNPAYLMYNVNADRYYGGRNPRYRLWKGSCDRDVYESRTIACFNLYGISVKELTFDGLTFLGCAYSNWCGPIRVDGLKAKMLKIRNCTFSGCKSMCVSISNTDHCIVEDCCFESNYDKCVYFGGAGRDVRVSGCSFHNNALGWANTFCIDVKAGDFVVSDNVIEDFSYGAIGFGEWGGGDKSGTVSGVVERNTICYSDPFFRDYPKHTLMDSGAIYAWTWCDDVTVRYNWIHDYVGMKDNRGIFLDDGANNVKIYGNVITGIPNSYCIDSRRVPAFENRVGKTNVNNVIVGNVLEGHYRLEGNESAKNGCESGYNVLLSVDGNSVRKPDVSNVAVSGDDMTVSCKSISNGVVDVDGKTLRRMQTLPYVKDIDSRIIH